MLDVAVIEDPAAAGATLDPQRARLLAALAEPASASTLSDSIEGMTRQKVNYHLRALESHGLVELVEERRKGNCIERVLQATAASYVISPEAFAPLAPDTTRSPDQLSARWLIALAARLVRDVGTLLLRATKAGQPLATLAIDADVRFASAADRAAFAAEVSEAIERAARAYHDPSAPRGRPHRIVFAMHPTITTSE